MRTILRQIEAHAAFAPQKPAFLFPDRAVTYEMVAQGIGSAQATFAGLKLDRESPVGILIDQPARHFIIAMALMKSGYTHCSIRPDQLQGAVSLGMNTVLTDARVPLTPGLMAHFVDEKWFTDRSPSHSFNIAMSANRITRILFTSGSTGRPKAIAWSHETLHRRIFDFCMTGIGASPRVMTTYGMSNAGFDPPMRALANGNTMVFSPTSDALATMSYFGVTEIRASVAQLRGLLETADASGAKPHVPLICPGGAPLSPDIADRLRLTFGSQIINTYASTETGHMAFASGRVLELRRAKGNCFMPAGDIEIVDENGTPLGRNKEGLIRARTHGMGRPFTGALDETAFMRGDGWFYPGDIGRIDEDGLLVVIGRADEVINDGGAKFDPQFLEDTLRRHPSVQDVGVSRTPTGEPGAVIVAHSAISLDDINRWIAMNAPGELGGVMLRRVVMADKVPMNSNGKIARADLRRLLTEH